MSSDHLCIEITQLGEIFNLVFVVAVEEYLVEAGEAKDFLIAVEFDLNRYDASAAWRNVHILKDRAG